MIRARLSELDLADLGEEIWTELYQRAGAALEKGAQVIVAAAKHNLSRPGSAKTVSKPGDSPEYDEGDLHDSVKLMEVRRTRHSIRQAYGSDHPGALLHEIGGTSRGEVKRTYPPRPYIRPAEETTRAEVDEILENL